MNQFHFSLFSAAHEFGHALYEQDVDPKFNGTFVSGGASMAMHESQSRFYENVVGRSYEFWVRHYPKLQEIFSEELDDVSLDEFYLYVNDVECSLIRTEADELTYPLHIMIRYDIEQKLLNKAVEVKDLPNRITAYISNFVRPLSFASIKASTAFS